MDIELIASLGANVLLAIFTLLGWARRGEARLDREELAEKIKDLDIVTRAKDALVEQLREQGREIAGYKAAAQERSRMLSEAGKKGNAASRAKRNKSALPRNARAKAKAKA